MTQEEFKQIAWGAGMVVEYKGDRYPVDSVIFGEALIGLGDSVIGGDEPIWVRCENVRLVYE